MTFPDPRLRKTPTDDRMVAMSHHLSNISVGRWTVTVEPTAPPSPERLHSRALSLARFPEFWRGAAAVRRASGSDYDAAMLDAIRECEKAAAAERPLGTLPAFYRWLGPTVTEGRR